LLAAFFLSTFLGHPVSALHRQGDQIGRIFEICAIVLLRQVFENGKNSQKNWPLFPHKLVISLLDKNWFVRLQFCSTFSRDHLVTLYVSPTAIAAAFLVLLLGLTTKSGPAETDADENSESSVPKGNCCEARARHEEQGDQMSW
jgi:hypothetical protein